jgi:NAD(P)-dependent dehydrogenase (short-subunit alcohol dehydrogenase family)
MSPPVAFVTGAAKGIGEGAARRLATDGWSLVLLDLDPKVEAVAAALAAETGVEVVAEVGSVAREDDVDGAIGRLVERFGGIDLAVANAGIGTVGELVDLDPADFDRTVAVNLRGVFLTCRAAGRIMRDQRRGSIVTIGSVFGWAPEPEAACYSATKAAIHALSQALAAELAPYGVRVNSIAPGYIETEGQWGACRARAETVGITFDEEVARIRGMVPLGRHGRPDEIGATVAFLASDDASYITGHTLGVTGGVVSR